jgi:glycosyltransferase involved in cell wall biosynthesis
LLLARYCSSTRTVNKSLFLSIDQIMDSPFISICIPTYKRPDLLKKLLDSIRMQSFTNYEVLINDNSPDDSVKDLVDSYQSILPVSYQKNEPALTATENCNTVMKRAKAPWIKVIHDDDWFATPDTLQQFADAAERSGKDFIFCASNQVNLETNAIEEERLDEERKKMLNDSVFSLFFMNVIGHPSVVMQRKDMGIQYDPAFNWVLDIDYYVRYLNKHRGYHYIDATLINIGKSAGQETYKYYKNKLVEIPEYFTLLTKYDSSLLLKNIYVFHLVWNMLVRFRIKNIGDIHALGYTAVMPDRLADIIKYQQWIPNIILKQPAWSKAFMKRCFKKLVQGL